MPRPATAPILTALLVAAAGEAAAATTANKAFFGAAESLCECRACSTALREDYEAHVEARKCISAPHDMPGSGLACVAPAAATVDTVVGPGEASFFFALGAAPPGLAPGAVIDVATFCYFACTPTQGLHTSPPGEPCRPLSREEVRALGGGRDLVDPTGVLLAAEARARQAREQEARKAAAERAARLLAQSVKVRQSAKAQQAKQRRGLRGPLADAREEAAALRAAHLEAGEKIGAASVDEAADLLRSAQEEATESARLAEAARVEVQEAKKAAAAQTASIEAAADAGAEKVVEAAKAAQTAHEKSEAARIASITNKPQIRASEAAAKAAEPFFTAMVRAQDTMKRYEAQGRQLTEEANAYRANAEALHADAAALKGLSVRQADLLEGKASNANKQAVALADAAKNAYATADATSKTLPQYQYNAKSAAARAAYDALPEWQPAPMMPVPAIGYR